ncbi:hypothetical protein XFEB_00102 [Xylella fastidiosa EB92.1]|nr:hypothetical protein XFEB_00102 [Xylella fastidiosa EB92.1]
MYSRSFEIWSKRFDRFQIMIFDVFRTDVAKKERDTNTNVVALKVMVVTVCFLNCSGNSIRLLIS